MMEKSSSGPIRELWNFPLLKALYGRRSRRFGMGMEMPPGPLAFKSRHAPAPLTRLEQALLVAAGTGVNGWTFGIPYSPATEGAHASYSLRLTGRTFPTGAAIGTPELFYTDDEGVYLTRLRDLPPTRVREMEDLDDIERILATCQQQIVRISDRRLTVPREVPHVFEHNLWSANFPGSTLFMPVADVGQYFLSLLMIRIQNRSVFYDDRNGRLAGDLEPYIRSGLLDGERRIPLTQMEQGARSPGRPALSTMAHNMVLTLQAMGLGGWMYQGINSYSPHGGLRGTGNPGPGFPVSAGPAVAGAQPGRSGRALREPLPSLLRRYEGGGPAGGRVEVRRGRHL